MTPTNTHSKIHLLQAGMESKIGIVCMTKSPPDMEQWLLHHHIHAGICNFYIRAEDTPHLESVFRSERWRDKVKFVTGTGTRNYYTQMQRQDETVVWAMEQAETDGCTHLAHIDDDELLYAPGGFDALRDYLCAIQAPWFKVKNLEAVYVSEDCGHPFSSTSKFLTNPTQFSAYTNGKAIARVSSGVPPFGPHAFVGKGSSVPGNILLVLHYESPCLQRWKEKFAAYAANNDGNCEAGDIPFAYYCDSIKSQEDAVWRKYKLFDEKKDHLTLRPFCRTSGWTAEGYARAL